MLNELIDYINYFVDTKNIHFVMNGNYEEKLKTVKSIAYNIL